MADLFTLVIIAVLAIAVQIALVRWLFKIDERLYEAKKTNHLLQQLLDQKKL